MLAESTAHVAAAEATLPASIDESNPGAVAEGASAGRAAAAIAGTGGKFPRRSGIFSARCRRQGSFVCWAGPVRKFSAAGEHGSDGHAAWKARHRIERSGHHGVSGRVGAGFGADHRHPVATGRRRFRQNGRADRQQRLPRGCADHDHRSGSLPPAESWIDPLVEGFSKLEATYVSSGGEVRP